MKSGKRKVGLAALVGGLITEWFRARSESGFSCRNFFIDITSLDFLKSQIVRLFNILRLNLWIITGNEISSGRELAILYAGHELGRNYLIKLAFGSSYRENYIGKKWLWKIPEIAKEDNKGCSLIVTEVPDRLRTLFERMSCMYIPFWIFGNVNISPHIIKDSVKTDIRRIRKNKLHYEVTNKLSELHDFYYNMYIPIILPENWAHS